MKHYLLDVYYIKANNKLVCTASKLDNSKIPQMTLSEYYDKVDKKEIHVDDIPFDATIKFFNLTKYDSLKDLDQILGKSNDLCYAEKMGPNIYL